MESGVTPSPPNNQAGSFPKFSPAILLAFVSTFLILAIGIDDYGFTWDEAETNFPAARNQVQWFMGLAEGEASLSETSIREHFETESDHPSLPRTMMAIGRISLPSSIGDRFAFRFPIALLVSFFTVCFYGVLRSTTGAVPAASATLLLVFHPRWFAHSHIAEYDILIAIAWWAAAVAFLWAHSDTEEIGDRAKWRRSFVAASFFGLALSTKLHAFFIPFPLLAWVVLFRRWEAWRYALLSGLMGPLLYFGTQPYLWWHTVERLQNRFLDYSQKVPITTYYLGDWYPGTVPWHYPWVMLSVTLPIGFLLFLGTGVLTGFYDACRRSFWETPRSRRLVFYTLNALTTPLIFSWKSPYDGIRLFMAALPFLAMIAAEGIRYCLDRIEPGSAGNRRKIFLSTVCLLILLQVVGCYRYHPFQLSYYSPLIGGVRGATRVGFETTYWCDALNGRFIEELARKVPGPTNISLHALDAHPMNEFRLAGAIPDSWRFGGEVVPDLYLVQFRQGFFGPFERRLVESDLEVVAENEIFGVPLVRVYKRPK